jgi:hypothetical protein
MWLWKAGHRFVWVLTADDALPDVLEGVVVYMIAQFWSTLDMTFANTCCHY